MSKLICWLRGHRWGTWFNKRTRQYHGINCERCGIHYGEVKDHP